MHMLMDTHTHCKNVHTHVGAQLSYTHAQTSFFLLAFFELCETSPKTRVTKASMCDQRSTTIVITLIQ